MTVSSIAHFLEEMEKIPCTCNPEWLAKMEDDPFIGHADGCEHNDWIYRGTELVRRDAPVKAPPPPRQESSLDRLRRESEDKRRKGLLSEYLVILSDAEAMPGLSAVYVRSDGAALIPEGKVSSICGDPSSCKSWIMLDVARAVASAGGRVLWWDFEDSLDSLLERCAAIGFGADDGLGNVGFLPPAVADDPGLVKQAALWVKQGDGPGLVIIDAMASAGCPSDGADISPWWDKHVKPFGTDQTILLGDHRPKRAEGRAPGGAGSVHKRSFLSGVLLLADGQPWTDSGGRAHYLDQPKG